MSAVFGAIAAALLTWLATMIRGVRKDVRTFMAQHLWLLAMAYWSRDSILLIMRELGIEPAEPPAMLDKER